MYIQHFKSNKYCENWKLLWRYRAIYSEQWSFLWHTCHISIWTVFMDVLPICGVFEAPILNFGIFSCLASGPEMDTIFNSKWQLNDHVGKNLTFFGPPYHVWTRFEVKLMGHRSAYGTTLSSWSIRCPLKKLHLSPLYRLNGHDH